MKWVAMVVVCVLLLDLGHKLMGTTTDNLWLRFVTKAAGFAVLVLMAGVVQTYFRQRYREKQTRDSN